MPVHRVPIEELEACMKRIEETERVVSTESAGDGAILVFTEPLQHAKRARPGEQETR